MEAFLLRGLFLMCCILLVQSLVCYNCQGMTNPALCKRAMTCKRSEVCYTERHQIGNHDAFYKLGCANDETCTKGRPSKDIPESVRFCCYTDRCNNKPRLESSLVCYNCQGMTNPVLCKRTMTCKRSEVCYTERHQIGNHDAFYKLGCANHQTCTKWRPSKDIPESVRFCCDMDRCNNKPRLEPGHATKRDCKAYKEEGLPSGVYTVHLCDGLPPFQVYCDMDTAGSGWTVFQQRKDGSVDFYRGWEDYKQGFGNLSGEFWLGNDHLHCLTKAGLTTLRVDLGDWEGNTAYAQYSSFQVGPASDYYKLNVSGYSGTAGDSLEYHTGMAFSTKDTDHDLVSHSNCAETYIGAWWHRACHYSNLNGKYYIGGKAPYGVGVVWYHWKGYTTSLKSAQMKLREP